MEPDLTTREFAQLFSLLEALDDPPPAVDPAALARRARDPRVTPDPAPATRNVAGSLWSGRRLRWAAAIALTFAGAGAAWAAPGSPLRAWIERVRDVSDGDVVAPLTEPDRAGISLEIDRPFEVAIAPLALGRVSFALVAGTTLTVESSNGATTFDSGSRGLRVASEIASDYSIEIPFGATDVSVLVGAEVVFRVTGGEVETTARSDGPGRWSIALSRVR